MSEYAKPVPDANAETAEFWDAAKRHEIALQRCGGCGEVRHPPLPVCPKCHSWEFAWRVVGGEGKVESWIVVHHVVYPAFAPDAPYNVALVSLDDCPNVRLTTNIVGCDSAEIMIGMPVTAVFEDVTEQVTLIKFRPA